MNLNLRSTLLFLLNLLPFSQLFALCNASFETNANANGDTICLGSPITFTNTSQVDGILLTAIWDFDDGQQSLSLNNSVTHLYELPGMYIVEYTLGSTVCSNLSVKDTIYVIEAPQLIGGIVHPSCFGLCDGEVSLVVNGAHPGYSFSWTNTPQTTSTISDLCAGGYTVTVSDVYGCVTVAGDYLLFDPPQLSAFAGNDIFACADDIHQMQGDVAGGTQPYRYLWTPGVSAGLDNDTILQPILTANNSSFGYFTLKVTDDKGCVAADSMEVKSNTASISGTIKGSITGNPITQGKVFLYHTGSSGHRWQIQSEHILTDGTYSFQDIPFNSYIILARPDRNVFPNTSPTYYGNLNPFDWNDATVITVGCDDNFTKNINVTELDAMQGTCSFTGGVYWSPGKTQSDDPIPFIDVVVKKTPPGNAIIYQPTDETTGEFTFAGIDTGGVYTFAVNIPGLPIEDNYEIEVVITDSLYQNLNFYVDTTFGSSKIYTLDPNGVRTSKTEKDKLAAFPNPFSDKVELRFVNEENGLFSFLLFDVSGKLVRNENNLHGKTLKLQTEMLDKGVYIAEIRTEQKVLRYRLLKE